MSNGSCVNLRPAVCARCGEEYQPERIGQRYCSATCKVRAKRERNRKAKADFRERKKREAVMPGELDRLDEASTEKYSAVEGRKGVKARTFTTPLGVRVRQEVRT